MVSPLTCAVTSILMTADGRQHLRSERQVKMEVQQWQSTTQYTFTHTVIYKNDTTYTNHAVNPYATVWCTPSPLLHGLSDIHESWCQSIHNLVDVYMSCFLVASIPRLKVQSNNTVRFEQWIQKYKIDPSQDLARPQVNLLYFHWHLYQPLPHQNRTVDHSKYGQLVHQSQVLASFQYRGTLTTPYKTLISAGASLQLVHNEQNLHCIHITHLSCLWYTIRTLNNAHYISPQHVFASLSKIHIWDPNWCCWNSYCKCSSVVYPKWKVWIWIFL